MLGKKISFLIFIGIALNIKAQISFYKTFGEPGNQIGNYVQQTLDSGYIVGGSYIIKTNKYGDAIWKKNYTSVNVKEVDNGAGFISLASDSCDLLKLDPNGDTLWSLHFTDYVSNKTAENFIETSDKNYLIAETKLYQTNPIAWGTHLLKIGKNGNPIFEATSSMNKYKTTEIYELVNKTIAAFAFRSYAFMNLFDSTGSLLARIDFNNSDFSGSTKTNDGGYILWYSSTNYFLMVKYDSTFTPLWAKKYFNSNYATFSKANISSTNDGGFALFGQGNLAAGNNHILLSKFDAVGNMAWAKSFKNTMSLGSGQQTADNGYIFTGTTSNTQSDIFLIKTDTYGTISCGGYDSTIIFTDSILIANTYSTSITVNNSTPTVPNLSRILPGLNTSNQFTETKICDYISTGIKKNEANDNELLIFPNPVNTEFTIQANKELGVVKLYNNLGQIVLQTQSKQNNIQIDVSQLPTGIYIINTLGKNSKLIKQ